MNFQFITLITKQLNQLSTDIKINDIDYMLWKKNTTSVAADISNQMVYPDKSFWFLKSNSYLLYYIYLNEVCKPR